MDKKNHNYAFIDCQNVYLGVKSLGWKLDFKRFRIYLKSKYKVHKAFLFIGYIAENTYLYRRLQKFDYILVFKPTLEKDGITKGNCDADLVLRCILEKDNFDTAVIVTGDGDFYCLIDYLEKQAKLLKIITPSFKYSSLLKEFAKYIVALPLLRKKLEYKKRDIPAVFL